MAVFTVRLYARNCETSRNGAGPQRALVGAGPGPREGFDFLGGFPRGDDDDDGGDGGHYIFTTRRRRDFVAETCFPPGARH